MLVLLVLDPFSLTSYADRISRDLFVKLKSPFYDSEYRDDIILVLFHENELPIFSGGDAYWPPTFKEYARIIDGVIKADPRAVFVDFLFLNRHDAGSFLFSRGIDLREGEILAARLARSCRERLDCTELLPGLRSLESEYLGPMIEAIDADRLDCFAGHAFSDWIQTDLSGPLCRSWEDYGTPAEMPFLVAAPPPVPVSSFARLQQVPGKLDTYRGASIYGGLHPEIERSFVEGQRHPPDESLQSEKQPAERLAAFIRNRHKVNVVSMEVEDRYTLALTPKPGYLQAHGKPVPMRRLCRPGAVLSAAARLYLISQCRKLEGAKGEKRRGIEEQIRAFSNRITHHDRAQITIQWGMRPMVESTGVEAGQCFAARDSSDPGGRNDLWSALCGEGWCGLRAFLELLKAGVNSDPARRKLWNHPQPAACAYHRQMTAREAYKHFLFGRTEPFKDKIVIIGASAQAARDFHDTPVNGQLPGAFFHAMALDNLLETEGRYTHTPRYRTFLGLTWSYDMLIESLTLGVISLLFFPRNLKRPSGRTMPVQEWLCRLQTLMRSMLGALFTVGLVIAVSVQIFDFTPLNWISVLTFTLGIAIFRGTDLVRPITSICNEPKSPGLRMIRWALVIVVLAALLVLGWRFTGWTLVAVIALVILLCVLPLPAAHQPKCSYHDEADSREGPEDTYGSMRERGPLGSVPFPGARPRRSSSRLKRIGGTTRFG